MSSGNRQPYLTATVLDQDLLDNCADNLVNQLEMICEIDTPAGTIYASDRNKYVGGTFYEALLVFPIIRRTVGELLSPTLEFSNIALEINNVDQRFNAILPAGASFDGWIGREVSVKIGLGDVASTYTEIFNGNISEEGGFRRTTKSIIFTARDRFEQVNQQFPTAVFKQTTFPRIEDDKVGLASPIIYGDWTVLVEPGAASVPAFVVNGEDPEANGEEEVVTIVNGSPAIIQLTSHFYDLDDVIRFETDGTLPTGLSTGTDYYVLPIDADSFNVASTPSGTPINTSGGSGNFSVIPQNRVNLELVISENDNTVFDTAEVYLKRGETYTQFDAADITAVSANRIFEIIQDNVTVVDPTGPTKFFYQRGDEIYVKVKGKSLSGYEDNVIEQARDLLISFGGLVLGDFNANWNTYRAKATPAESAISTFKSRIWVQDKQSVLEYALSLLEQVRLEFFVDRDLKIKINSLHFDDWVASPSFELKNWDIEQPSFEPRLDDRNNFNRVQGSYNYLPNRKEQAQLTPILRNSAAITQIGKEISKLVEFPNLYETATVNYQLTEILKLASSYLEHIEVNLTWRSLLLDIGDFVKINVSIQGTIFENVPAMVREIGYDPAGIKIPVRLWSFQMVPFPGHSPGYAGITGGSTATITTE